MKPKLDIVDDYIRFFFTEVAGFKDQDVKYVSMGHSESEYLAIAMDKINRLDKKNGRLRERVWSNCYFIFHNDGYKDINEYKLKTSEIKKTYPFIFIRSYVYFIFVDFSNKKQTSMFAEKSTEIEKKNYKIWFFNTKYEVVKLDRKTNIFNISLKDDEAIDDYVYLANPDSELERMEAANSDAVDCVRAYTGSLEIFFQTNEMIDNIKNELNTNPSARIIVEGPARSGKTIIAATLLGEHKDSKFLLMNYFFYQAIVDGFHALSNYSKEEIDQLVKNPEIELWVSLKDNMVKILKYICNSLEYAIEEHDNPKDSNTKKMLIDNISKLTQGIEKTDFEKHDLLILKSLCSLRDKLSSLGDEKPFTRINIEDLKKLREIIKKLLSSKKLDDYNSRIQNVIENFIKNSKQKFFHHNINKSISSKVSEGCWIKRGVVTTSNMWTDKYKPQLIICDEVQRLGVISRYYSYDEFDEVKQIIDNSQQSFFTGDNFQMLNHKYDKGIDRIINEIEGRNQAVTRYSLPQSVGVPAEIGSLMKYITNPKSFDISILIKQWSHEREFEIIFIKNDFDKLVELFDEDPSSKKHFASPVDHGWMDHGKKFEIKTHHRKKHITLLSDHEIDNFAYKFPYYCNEEIMPNYILSAYELISRELESLYVHIPFFGKMEEGNEEWYRKHLYVLFTRPTSRLVVNFFDQEDFDQMIQLIENIKSNGAKVSVTIFCSD